MLKCPDCIRVLMKQLWSSNWMKRSPSILIEVSSISDLSFTFVSNSSAISAMTSFSFVFEISNWQGNSVCFNIFKMDLILLFNPCHDFISALFSLPFSSTFADSFSFQLGQGPGGCSGRPRRALAPAPGGRGARPRHRPGHPQQAAQRHHPPLHLRAANSAR